MREFFNFLIDYDSPLFAGWNGRAGLASLVIALLLLWVLGVRQNFGHEPNGFLENESVWSLIMLFTLLSPLLILINLFKWRVSTKNDHAESERTTQK